MVRATISASDSCSGLSVAGTVSPLVPEEPPELLVLGVENVPKQAAPRAAVRGALESEKTSSQSQSGHRGSDRRKKSSGFGRGRDKLRKGVRGKKSEEG